MSSRNRFTPHHCGDILSDPVLSKGKHSETPLCSVVTCILLSLFSCRAEKKKNNQIILFNAERVRELQQVVKGQGRRAVPSSLKTLLHYQQEQTTWLKISLSSQNSKTEDPQSSTYYQKILAVFTLVQKDRITQVLTQEIGISPVYQ